MKEDLVDLLTSDSFRLLCLLDGLQTTTTQGRRIRESQDEIAQLFHVSKGKLNPLMQSLVTSGCLRKYRARSGYVVTERGEKVLACIRQLEHLER